MYPAKKASYLELLTNALSAPTSRTWKSAKAPPAFPARREEAVERAIDESRRTREIYFATARLLWWNR